jgi:hypothetical protein
LNMEMPISLIILPLNATTGIALIAIWIEGNFSTQNQMVHLI